MSNASSTTTNRGKLEVLRVFENTNQKQGTLTAEIKQKVTTVSEYPTKQISNDMQDSLFDKSDFKFEPQTYTTDEERVAWIDVPTGSTMESVTAKLATMPNSMLYRVLSSQPIIASNQQTGIDSGLTTKDTIGNRQVVRNADGGLILNSGKVQYRRIFWSKEPKNDVDSRDLPEYKTAELEAELSGTVIEDTF